MGRPNGREVEVEVSGQCIEVGDSARETTGPGRPSWKSRVRTQSAFFPRDVSFWHRHRVLYGGCGRERGSMLACWPYMVCDVKQELMRYTFLGLRRSLISINQIKQGADQQRDPGLGGC